MPLAHPPPNLQPILLALETTSTILSTPLPNAHPPLYLQPALLALEPTLNYPTHTLASCSSRNLIYLLNCNQINFFDVQGTKKVCPPTFTTTCPFRSQSISNLTNSFSIPVGMDEYSITHFLLLIRSPAAILNSPINLCLPLDTALVGRRFSFNFS